MIFELNCILAFHLQRQVQAFLSHYIAVPISLLGAVSECNVEGNRNKSISYVSLLLFSAALCWLIGARISVLFRFLYPIHILPNSHRLQNFSKTFQALLPKQQRISYIQYICIHIKRRIRIHHHITDILFTLVDLLFCAFFLLRENKKSYLAHIKLIHILMYNHFCGCVCCISLNRSYRFLFRLISLPISSAPLLRVLWVHFNS